MYANIGDKTAIIGTNLSLVESFVSNPNAKIPKIGPYVYEAALKTAVTTLGLFIKLKIKITANIIIENEMCIKVLFLFALAETSSKFIFKKSNAKDVVKAVKAESALENAAEIIPNKKTIPANNEKYCNASIGNNLSEVSGRLIPFCSV
jgi:hypothetical protein